MFKRMIRSKGIVIWNDLLKLESPREELVVDVYKQLGQVTQGFLKTAWDYDPEIDRADVFKAGRTVWFMIAFQLIMGIKIELTTSIFGYNMLYPYTDNVIDNPNISKEEKKQFAINFRLRLQGKVSQSTTEYEKKPFDMVTEIEKQWSREGHDNLYESLLCIHDAQTLSGKQITEKVEDLPSIEEITKISIQKGGASLLAAGHLVSGTLTEEQIVFLEYLGFALQLLDDLQDVQEDLKNNQMTLFSSAVVRNEKLDNSTAKLINFIHQPLLSKLFVNEKEDELPLYVRKSMVRFSTILIIEAACKLPQYYSVEFFNQLENLSPIPFKTLAKVGVENVMFDTVQYQKI